MLYFFSIQKLLPLSLFWVVKQTRINLNIYLTLTTQAYCEIIIIVNALFECVLFNRILIWHCHRCLVAGKTDDYMTTWRGLRDFRWRHWFDLGMGRKVADHYSFKQLVYARLEKLKMRNNIGILKQHCWLAMFFNK